MTRQLTAAGSLLFLTLASAGAPARADEAFRCELVSASGLLPSDAGTAAQLVCDELKSASGGRGAFGITLTTLGKLVIVNAAREGTTDVVTVRVDAIEDLPQASERIAQALVRGQSFAATQRVDNLLPDETRPALTKKGSLKFTVGVADIESAGHGARASGFSFGMVYATPKFALPAEMRFGWDDSNYDEPGLNLFSISVGGRRYLSNRNVSPFVGAGLGILMLHARDGGFDEYGRPTGDYFDGERFGAAPYLELGVEALRLHRGRIGLQVRADLPTGSLESSGYLAEPSRSKYVVSVTIGLTAAF